MATVTLRGTLKGPKPLDAATLTRVSKVVRKAAFDIEAQAKVRAPVDTGFLRSSIAAEIIDPLTYKVVVGAHYGIYQEFGTSRMPAQPFLIPAAEFVRPRFLEAMRHAIGDRRPA